jgi:hypothetical protein
MPQIKSGSVEKLKEWLCLPVSDDDQERKDRKIEIEVLSSRFGLLVFEDERWYEYDEDRITSIMQRQGQEWLDETQVSELERLTDTNDLMSFLAWFEPALAQWEAGESGAAGPAMEGQEAGQALGIANPNYATDPVPGTQFYKYDPVAGYLYADSEDATQWRSLEEIRDAQGSSEESAQDNGTQRGYPNSQATIPGTRYYTLQDGTYLYSHEEYGDDDHGWQPYEYWRELQQPRTATETQPTETQPAPATIDEAVEEATTAVFTNLDAELLAGLDLSPEDIDRIADTVAAEIAVELASSLDD